MGVVLGEYLVGGSVADLGVCGFVMMGIVILCIGFLLIYVLVGLWVLVMLVVLWLI